MMDVFIFEKDSPINQAPTLAVLVGAGFAHSRKTNHLEYTQYICQCTSSRPDRVEMRMFSVSLVIDAPVDTS
jgi:hypothetical protein